MAYSRKENAESFGIGLDVCACACSCADNRVRVRTCACARACIRACACAHVRAFVGLLVCVLTVILFASGQSAYAASSLADREVDTVRLVSVTASAFGVERTVTIAGSTEDGAADDSAAADAEADSAAADDAAESVAADIDKQDGRDLFRLPRLCPMVLCSIGDPASIEAGIDCGMDWMCGLYPCLCGSADAYGGCSCNGTEVLKPQTTYVSDDESVVRVVEFWGNTWLVPVGAGKATITCTTSLKYYNASEARFEVSVDGFTLADAALAGTLILLLVSLVAVAAGVREIVRILKARAEMRTTVRRTEMRTTARLSVRKADGQTAAGKTVPPSVMLAVFLCIGAAAMSAALTACSKPLVNDTSPQVASVQLSCSSDMTESSQRAEIRLEFDQTVSISGSAADDFTLLLNGEKPADTIAVETIASANSLTFVLRPSSAATAGGTAGTYFALYASAFSLSSARSDHALPSIVNANGACAVLDAPVTGTLPSGLTIEILSLRAGSDVTGDAASAVIRVDTPAQIRAITWFSLDGGETLLLKHNHNFAAADAAACAADLAKTVNEAHIGINARAVGDEVTFTAGSVLDGQTIDPVVVCGVGIEGGTYDPSLGDGSDGDDADADIAVGDDAAASTGDDA